MIKPENFFKQIFNDSTISDLRLIKYAEVALQRLLANNKGGKFTSLAEALTISVTEFKKAVADRNIIKAQLEGTTIMVNDLINEFRKRALQREGLIRDTFGVDSAEYQEFYPHGTSEYTRMCKTNAGQLMHRMADAYALHESELPEERVEEMQKLNNDYSAARSLQLEKMAGLADKQLEKTESRTRLETRLQYNLLIIASEFIGKPEMYRTYFEHNQLFGIVTSKNHEDQ